MVSHWQLLQLSRWSLAEYWRGVDFDAYVFPWSFFADLRDYSNLQLADVLLSILVAIVLTLLRSLLTHAVYMVS